MSADAAARHRPSFPAFDAPWGGGREPGAERHGIGEYRPGPNHPGPVTAKIVNPSNMPAPVAPPDRRMFELARKLAEAKRAEDSATAVRVALEEEIAAAHGFDREDGQETVKVDGDYGRAKITIKQNVYRKTDEDKIPDVKRALGKRFSDVFRTKHEVVVKELASLEKNDHDLYLIACSAVQKSLGKVSVSVAELVVV